MGGQIARYALSYMEANNLPHNTRLYVSLDSPHNGANIPIGLQHFIKYFATETGDYQLVQALAALDSPASLELTQHYYGMGTYFLPHPRRTAFMNAVQGFRPGGFPVDLRRVAVTNGALDGVRQRDQNGQIINDLDQAFFLEQKGTPGRSTAGVFVRWLFPFSQSFSIATRLITTASARVWYAPGNGQTNRVLRTYILGTGAHSQEAAGVANSCGLDGAPGGYRNFFSEVADGNNSSGLFQRRSFYSMRDKAVFIPMLSALAYTPTSYNNCTSLSGTDLVCTGTTPFDAYYGPVGHSEAHIQLTPENVEFMRNEILLKTPTPVFTQAPASACPAGGTFTFQVKQECTATRSGQQQPATTYNWTVTAGGTFAGNVQQLTGAGPTQAVTIAPAPSNTNVAVSVTAIRAGYATSTTVTKFIYITDAYATVAAPGEVVKYDVFDAVLDQANTTGPYTWSVSPPFKASIPNTATGPSIKVVARNAGQITISATGTDVCTGAPITALSATVTITTGGLRPAAAPAAYPNPADAVLNLATPETAEATAAPRTAVLYNAQGREVRRNSPAKAAELPTADLPAGLYYLLVEQGGHVSRSQIRVQH